MPRLFRKEKTSGNSFSVATLWASIEEPNSVALIPEAVLWTATIATRPNPRCPRKGLTACQGIFFVLRQHRGGQPQSGHERDREIDTDRDQNRGVHSSLQIYLDIPDIGVVVAEQLETLVSHENYRESCDR